MDLFVIWFGTELHASCKKCNKRYSFGNHREFTEIADTLDGHDCLKDN